MNVFSKAIDKANAEAIGNNVVIEMSNFGCKIIDKKIPPFGEIHFLPDLPFPPVCFAAIMIVGDNSGRVGYGTGKAKEVPEAIKKATDSAKKGLFRVSLREGRTLHHDIIGSHGSSKVVMRSAPSGTGIIAGGSIRAVFELLGIQDIVAKSLGSSNPRNVLRACLNGLKSSYDAVFYNTHGTFVHN